MSIELQNADDGQQNAYLRNVAELAQAHQQRELGAALALQIFRLLKIVQLHAIDNMAVLQQIDQTVEALRGFGAATGEALTLLFAKNTVFVAGHLLKASRGEYENALELGTMIRRLGVSEVMIETDANRSDLTSLARLFQQKDARAENGVIEPSPRIRLRYVPPARMDDEEDLSIEEQVVRTYATSVVVMRRIFENLTNGRYQLPHHAKRLAQRLVMLSEGDAPAFLGITAMRNLNHDAAGRAVNRSILAVTMARQLTTDLGVLARIAMSALFFDVAHPLVTGIVGRGNDVVVMRMTEDAEQRLPAATALVLTALGQLRPASMIRTVIGYESHWMRQADRFGPLYGGARRAMVAPRIVATANRFNELLEPDLAASTTPTPDEAIERMRAEAKDATERAMLALLVGALGIFPRGTAVQLNTGERGVVTKTPAEPADYVNPTVRLVYDAAGQLLKARVALDLVNDPARQVVGVIDADAALAEAQAKVLAATPAPAPAPQRPPSEPPDSYDEALNAVPTVPPAAASGVAVDVIPSAPPEPQEVDRTALPWEPELPDVFGDLAPEPEAEPEPIALAPEAEPEPIALAPESVTEVLEELEPDSVQELPAAPPAEAPPPVAAPPEPVRAAPARAGRPVSPGVMPVAPPRALRLPSSEDATVIHDSSDLRSAEHKSAEMRSVELTSQSYPSTPSTPSMPSSSSSPSAVLRRAAGAPPSVGPPRKSVAPPGIDDTPSKSGALRAPPPPASGPSVVRRTSAAVAPPQGNPAPGEDAQDPLEISEVEPSAPSIQWRRAPKTLPPNEREAGGGIDQIHAPSASGSFERTPFSHILLYLLDRSLSGTLIFTEPVERKEDSPVEHAGYFQEGIPTKLHTGRKVAPLGATLVAHGLLEQSQLEGEPISQPPSHEATLETELIEFGLVTADQIAEVRNQQLEERLIYLFGLPQGTKYSFYNGLDLLEAIWGNIPGMASPLATLTLGLRAHPEEAQMDRVLTRLAGNALHLHPESDLEAFELDVAEATVADAIGMTQASLPELVEAGHDPDVIRRVVYLLMVTRCIAPIEAAPRATSRPARSSTRGPKKT
ncbi:MAG: hypothetical protein HYZ29_25490 [Myxococcales bacterium]|nr:hypothetical protein [Myxococcales bacterium]